MQAPLRMSLLLKKLCYEQNIYGILINWRKLSFYHNWFSLSEAKEIKTKREKNWGGGLAVSQGLRLIILTMDLQWSKGTVGWMVENRWYAPSSPFFTLTPLHIITTDPDNAAANNYTINASAAISSMFYLSLSYHKWLAQQLLAVGGVSGSSWHSSRRWHPTAADQASIQTQFRLSQNKYTVYVCEIGCSYSWEAHLVKISCALVQPHGLR